MEEGYYWVEGTICSLRVAVSIGWCSWPGVCWPAGTGGLLCLQGLKERTYANSGEAITSLPVSIPLSTVQPSKLPVSIPLASVVLPSRAEKVVSGHCGAGLCPRTLLFPEHQPRQRVLVSALCPPLLNCVLLNFEHTIVPKKNSIQNPDLITVTSCCFHLICFCKPVVWYVRAERGNHTARCDRIRKPVFSFSPHLPSPSHEWTHGYRTSCNAVSPCLY